MSNQFQSTHSLRSATYTFIKIFYETQVSIHALLAECDLYNSFVIHFSLSFNPRTPCGVRPPVGENGALYTSFQSTHSLRSATVDVMIPALLNVVSIHALLAECDPPIPRGPGTPKSFNPRTPCGVRLRILS